MEDPQHFDGGWLSAAIFTLPNFLEMLGIAIYMKASTSPFTSIAAILRSSHTLRLLFRVLHFVVSIVAVVLNLAFLVPNFRNRGRLPVIAIAVFALVPLYGVYLIE